jgi:DnaJ-class molecular chaperone
MERVFDPGKVGLVHCPLCNGEGKLPEEKGGLNVCPECEGFGMIRRKETTEEKTVEFRGMRIILPK